MKQLLTVLSVLLISKLSYAGFVAEPYLGYQMGKAEGTYVAGLGGGSSKSDDTGTVLGARLGYSFLIPVVSLDYSMYSGKDDASPSNDMKQTNMALTVGAQMIPLLRPYAGYIFSAKNKVDDVTFKGTGLKLGLGIKILPLLNINIEMSKMDYKDIEGIPGYTKVSDVYSDFKYSTTMIGISYVF